MSTFWVKKYVKTLTHYTRTTPEGALGPDMAKEVAMKGDDEDVKNYTDAVKDLKTNPTKNPLPTERVTEPDQPYSSMARKNIYRTDAKGHPLRDDWGRAIHNEGFKFKTYIPTFEIFANGQQVEDDQWLLIDSPKKEEPDKTDESWADINAYAETRSETSGHPAPKVFSHTLYKVPTIDELMPFESHPEYTAEDIMDEIWYTIVGRGIMNDKNKQMIIDTIKRLISAFPGDDRYAEALILANEIKPRFK